MEFFAAVVQPLSCVRLFTTPWTAEHQASLSLSLSQSLPKFMSIESVMPSNHLILCHPLLLLLSIFPSIRVFSNKLALHIRWPKYWSFSFSISPSKLTHWKRPWCLERLSAGREGDDRGWDGWTASPTQWTRVWVNSRSWWWTGRPGMLQFMGSRRVRRDWVTELNWTELNSPHWTSFTYPKTQTQRPRQV